MNRQLVAFQGEKCLNSVFISFVLLSDDKLNPKFLDDYTFKLNQKDSDKLQ